MNSLKLKKSVAGALMVFSLVPALVFAEDNAGTASNSNTETGTPVTNIKKGDGNFCSRLSALQSKTAEQATKAEEKQAKNESKRNDSIAKKEGDVDAKRAEGRTDMDSKRLKHWDNMVTNAKTDAQKAAVEAYKTAITSAVTARRASVDAAVKAYRDALTTAMVTRSSAVTTAVTAFKASMSTALTKAQADCTAGVASKTVKDAFNKAMSDAKKVLGDARKSANDASGIKDLKKTRDDAIKAAETTFKTATEKARADLVLAMK